MASSQKQSAFTLLELLVVIGIIGILSFLGLTSFRTYRADAAYSVAESVLHHSRVAIEASTNDIDHPPAAVSMVQNVRGPILDAAGRSYMPGMQIPSNVKLTANYDPTCVDSSCQSDFVEVKHCLGNEYLQWIRFGDGLEVSVPNVLGMGC